MLAIPSAKFLKEFTIYAEQAADEKETFIIQRSNGKNIVMMSLESFNDLQRRIYMANATAENK